MEGIRKTTVGVIATLALSGGAVSLDAVSQDIPLACDVTSPSIEQLETKLRTYQIDEGFLKKREMESKDRAEIKGCEVAKRVEAITTQKGAYQIQIVNTEKIEGGVQVFARVWKNGSQIGFGDDGTVDIERFRIFNPPILVPDPNGTIVLLQESPAPWRIKEFPDKELRYREDPQAAVIDVITQNLTAMKNIHSAEKIELGKIGNTTSTFYPDANAESTSVDGNARFLGTAAVWATLIGKNGTQADDTSGANGIRWQISGGGATGAASTFDVLYRSFTYFDTSAISDSDTITSATWSLYIDALTDEFSVDPTMTLMGATLGSNTAVVAGDFQGTFSNQTEYATAKSYSDFSLSSYEDYALNATGVAAVSKTSITKIGVRFVNDVTGGTTPQQASAAREFWVIGVAADAAGTTQDPKLVVEHSGSSAADQSNDLILFQ